MDISAAARDLLERGPYRGISPDGVNTNPVYYGSFENWLANAPDVQQHIDWANQASERGWTGPTDTGGGIGSMIKGLLSGPGIPIAAFAAPALIGALSGSAGAGGGLLGSGTTAADYATALDAADLAHGGAMLQNAGIPYSSLAGSGATGSIYGSAGSLADWQAGLDAADLAHGQDMLNNAGLNYSDVAKTAVPNASTSLADYQAGETASDLAHGQAMLQESGVPYNSLLPPGGGSTYLPVYPPGMTPSAPGAPSTPGTPTAPATTPAPSSGMDKLMEWIKANPASAAALGLTAYGVLDKAMTPKEEPYKPTPIDQSIVAKYGGIPGGGAVAGGTPNYQGFQSLSSPQGLLQMRLDKMKKGLL